MSAIPTRDRVDPETVQPLPLRRPEWIKVRAPSGETYEHLQTLMRSKALHTVCEEAMCPNMGECWGIGHRHLPDAGRCVHAHLRLLRHQARPPAGPRLAGAGTRGPGGQVDGPEACRHHLRQPRRPPRRRRAHLCHGHPPHPRSCCPAARSRCSSRISKARSKP